MARVLSKNKPSQQQIDQAIQRGEEIASLLEHPGWKHVESFIAQAKEGTHAYMEKEVSAVSTFTFASLLGTYAKYLMMLFENRAYNKLKTYVRVSIQTGQKFAEENRKRERALEATANERGR